MPFAALIFPPFVVDVKKVEAYKSVLLFILNHIGISEKIYLNELILKNCILSVAMFVIRKLRLTDIISKHNLTYILKLNIYLLHSLCSM